MRILFCNKYNYPFSGTETYLFQVMELLRSKGHEVALFSMSDPRGEPTPYDQHFLPNIDFKKQSGWFRKAELAAHAIYSREARRRIRAMIAEFQPDIAHVRNIYHHLSPSILWELKAQSLPVIYHLNDFKVLCPNYNFVAYGEVCEACKGGEFWRALQKKCYPGWSARMALVTEAYVHKWLGTYRKCVDCFLAPSEFVKNKFIEHGWDAPRFKVLPHFQEPKKVTVRRGEGAPLLYFGRMSKEKGVADLLRAMQRLPHLRLLVAGEGPERVGLEELTKALGLANVTFAGHLGDAELERAIADSRFTVFPSHAYETLGKTILESYAQGRTVVATDLGSRRELVREGGTGLLYQPGDVDQLAAALEFLSSQPELADQMGQAGRKLVCEKFSPDLHYQTLIRLYEQFTENSVHLSAGSQQAKSRMKIAAPGVDSWISTTIPDGFVPLQRLTFAPPLANPVDAPPTAKKRQLRVAFIGGRGLVSKYSGIETCCEEIGARLAGMGHHVTVYCRTYFTPPGKEHQGMHIVRLPTIRSKHLETLVHTFLSTMHVLSRPCDIVHYHAVGPALFSFIPRVGGKKTVVTVQGLDWQRKKWGRIAAAVLRLGERAAVRLPSETIVVSQTLQRHYRAVHRAETSYVPNGGLLRERRLPDKIFDCGLEPGNYILFLGRFSPEKGCHLLVEAHKKLNTGVMLVMAGAASYCDDYSRQLRTHANEHIKMLDWVSGAFLDELLTNAMIFVLPSDLEGLSLALLDAMGAGLCVLCSDVEENREAIDGAGFTFRRGDAEDLAERLRFLIANPTVREAAGRAAEKRVREHYQWSEIAVATQDLYLEMLGWDLKEGPTRKPSGSVSLPASGSRQRAG